MALPSSCHHSWGHPPALCLWSLPPASARVRLAQNQSHSVMGSIAMLCISQVMCAQHDDWCKRVLGIIVGGRTGVTAITTSLLFFIALFFTPIFGASLLVDPSGQVGPLKSASIKCQRLWAAPPFAAHVLYHYTCRLISYLLAMACSKHSAVGDWPGPHHSWCHDGWQHREGGLDCALQVPYPQCFIPPMV